MIGVSGHGSEQSTAIPFPGPPWQGALAPGDRCTGRSNTCARSTALAGTSNAAAHGGAAALRDPTTLLARMQPVLNPGCYAFVTLPDGLSLDAAQIVASIREHEGHSVIVAEQLARDLGLAIAFRAAWITPVVHSDLEAVGLTAAFARTLAQAGIGCNVVAGVHHDHLFVPVDLAEKAMDALLALQASAA